MVVGATDLPPKVFFVAFAMTSPSRSFFNMSPGRILLFSLRITWVICVLYYELDIFIHGMKRCQWPSILSSENQPNFDTEAGAAHVLVIADPHILDAHSHVGKLYWLHLAIRYVVDLNMKKAWRAAQRMNPDAVVFLGDLMDNGKSEMPYQQYDRYFTRFQRIFSTDTALPRFFLPGNHDIGSNGAPILSEYARKRYVSNFGEFNPVVSIANHTLVFLDAPGLMQSDQARLAAEKSFSQWSHTSGDTVEFIRAFGHSAAHNTNNEKVILFSHIPMFRDADSICGSGQEHHSGEHTTLGREAATFLLDNLQPSLIISDEEHDACEFTHIVNDRNTIPRVVREVTVKAFNMMSIKRPAFHMLTMVPPDTLPEGTTETFSDSSCLLPDQNRIYFLIYAPLSVLTLVVLALSNWHRVRTSVRYRRTHPRASSSGLWSQLAVIDGHAARTTGLSCSVSAAHSRTSSITILEDIKEFSNITCSPWYQAELEADLIRERDEEKHSPEPDSLMAWGSSFFSFFKAPNGCAFKTVPELDIWDGMWWDVLKVAIYPLTLGFLISVWLLNA